MVRGSIERAQLRQNIQYNRKASPKPYLVGGRVMVYMPSEDRRKKRKLVLPYHGPNRILEVWSKTVLVRPVDVPDTQLILVSIGGSPEEALSEGEKQGGQTCYNSPSLPQLSGEQFTRVRTFRQRGVL